MESARVDPRQALQRLRLDARRARRMAGDLAVQVRAGAESRIARSLEQNLQRVEAALGRPADLVVHRLRLGAAGGSATGASANPAAGAAAPVPAALVYLASMTDSAIVNRDILPSLLEPGAL